MDTIDKIKPIEEKESNMYEYRLSRIDDRCSPIGNDKEAEPELQSLGQKIDYNADRIDNGLIREICCDKDVSNINFIDYPVIQKKYLETSKKENLKIPDLTPAYPYLDPNQNSKKEEPDIPPTYNFDKPNNRNLNHCQQSTSQMDQLQPCKSKTFGPSTQSYYYPDTAKSDEKQNSLNQNNFTSVHDQGYYSVISSNSCDKSRNFQSKALHSSVNEKPDFFQSTPKIVPPKNEFMYDDLLSLPLGHSPSALVSNMRQQFPNVPSPIYKNERRFYYDLDKSTKCNQKLKNESMRNSCSRGEYDTNVPRTCLNGKPNIKLDTATPPHLLNLDNQKGYNPYAPVRNDVNYSPFQHHLMQPPKSIFNMNAPSNLDLNFRNTPHFEKINERLNSIDNLTIPDMIQQERLQHQIDANFKPIDGSSFIFKVPKNMSLNQYIDCVYINGSMVYSLHPMCQLVRDLRECDCHFWQNSFPYKLVTNLPVDFQHLLQNFKRSHYQMFINYMGNSAIGDELTEVARYLHTSIIMKLHLRQDQALQNMYNHGKVAAEDVCTRFSRVVHNGAFKRGPDDSFFKSQNFKMSNAMSTPTKLRKSSSSKKHTNLPKEAIEIMMSWLREHKTNPYPNEIEKSMLVQATRLTMNQINYWFTNARRRILPKWALAAHKAQNGEASKNL